MRTRRTDSPTRQAFERLRAGDSSHEIAHVEALAGMRAIPDATFDGCVTDPPYGLGNREPNPEELAAFVLGVQGVDTGGDFLGRAWNLPTVAHWRELYRVLKPGAHVFAFGGTRTSYLIALGLRCAGFEIRDSLAWLHGQGWPKGGDIGKRIGEAWRGYGTQIKPAHEPIIVARKPFEGTLAGNVLEHGCGALHIDAARIATDWNEPDRGDAWKRSGHSGKPDASKIAAPAGNGIECNPLGRWPANVALEHAPGCELVGSKQIERRLIDATNKTVRPSSYGGSNGGSKGIGTVQETVADWRCVDGCPVRELDEQAGTRKSGTRKSGTRKSGTRKGVGYGGGKGDGGPAVDGSEGGASRFFYCSKSSPAERDRGVASWQWVEDKSAALGWRRCDAATFDATPEKQRATGNVHACVKPIGLLRWLLRLAVRPGGFVIDPFVGSGSTACAGELEGFPVIGLELDGVTVEIAQARAAYHAGQRATEDRSSVQPVQLELVAP